MSHLVIVGASSGIGRDIQPHMRAYGHEVSAVPRGDYPDKGDAILFCQRTRGPADAWGVWRDEIKVSLDTTKRLIEYVGDETDIVSVVVMASVAGVSVEEEQPVGYHACKAALIEMVRYYAVTLGSRGIRVNAIIPGLVIKPEARPFYDTHPELEATYKDITPLGRMCTVEDIAFEVNHLIDPRCYKTGQVSVVDGGIGLRTQYSVARRVIPELRDLQVTQRKPAHV